jgi:transposase
MAMHYIGADVDCNTTALAVRCGRKIVAEYRVPTSIPALAAALDRISGPRHLTIEEGSMADWLYRNLRGRVEEMTVCDPRRNRLIVGDGDKTNAIDAKKLAELQQGGYTRAVYHGATQERLELKQWVGLYHDRVKEAVRQVNKIRARARMHGARLPAGFLKRPKTRGAWLKGSCPAAVAGQLEVLLAGYDSTAAQARRCRAELARRGAGEEVLARWQAVPGIGLIRGVTFLAYLDTPWRFAHRSKRWKYCGVGLERASTGTDRHGRDKPGRRSVCQACNHRLKDVVLGAALSAVAQGHNKYRLLYDTLIQEGVHDGNARRAVARKLIDTLVGMWKTGSAYMPELA